MITPENPENPESPENLKIEELFERHALTFGELREFIYRNSMLPNNTPVMIERITDNYFTPGQTFNGNTLTPWATLKMPDGYHEWDNEYVQGQSIFEQDGVILVRGHY